MKGEEVLTLILKAKGGDRRAMTQLVTQHEGLLRKEAARVCHAGSGQLEDLVQVGRLAMVKAIETYSTPTQFTFASAVRKSARWAMLEYVARWNNIVSVPRRSFWAGKRSQCINLDTLVEEGSREGALVEETDVHAELVSCETNALVRSLSLLCLGLLPKQQADALVARYDENLTLKELSRKEKKTEACVKSRLLAGRQKLGTLLYPVPGASFDEWVLHHESRLRC